MRRVPPAERLSSRGIQGIHSPDICRRIFNVWDEDVCPIITRSLPADREFIGISSNTSKSVVNFPPSLHSSNQNQICHIPVSTFNTRSAMFTPPTTIQVQTKGVRSLSLLYNPPTCTGSLGMWYATVWVPEVHPFILVRAPCHGRCTERRWSKECTRCSV